MRVGWAVLCLAFVACDSSKPAGGACSADPDCKGGLACSNAVCQPLCTRSRGCDAGECRRGVCETTCGGKTCGPTERCLNDTCWPTECNGVQCPPDYVCKGDECIDARCLGVVCPAAQVCFQGVCVDLSCVPGRDGG